MQVFVYPEINCKYENGRWKLLPPSEEVTPLTEFKAEPIPVLTRLTRQIRLEDGVYRIDAALWKQSDGYFVVDSPEDRYDPSKIKDYHDQNPNFSVDEQDTGAKGTDELKIYCAPNPVDDPGDDEVHERCALPQYESERVEVVILQRLQTLEPTQGVVPVEQQGPQPIIASARRKE